MADVFLSYASEDRDRAAKLAQALELRGWSVWWDRKITTGHAYDDVIEREIELARCVVVLWSDHSVPSEWVRNEASAGAARGVLVPAFIDAVQIPLEFRRKQTADLVSWTGEGSHSGLASLCDGVAQAVGHNGAEDRPGAPPPTEQPRPRSRRPLVIAAVVGVVGLSVLVGSWRVSKSTSTLAQKGRDHPAGAVVEADASVSDIRNPLPTRYGVTYHARLAEGDELFLELESPTDQLSAVLDVRRPGERRVEATLQVLGENGGSLPNSKFLRVSHMGADSRETASRKSAQAQAEVYGLKLVAETGADYWWTVFVQPPADLVPFFGELVPQSLTLGEEAARQLETRESGYFQVALPPGAYQVVLDLERLLPRGLALIQTKLSRLQDDGGGAASLSFVNKNAKSHREIADIIVKEDTVLILKIYNAEAAVGVRLRVVPDAAP